MVVGGEGGGGPLLTSEGRLLPIRLSHSVYPCLSWFSGRDVHRYAADVRAKGKDRESCPVGLENGESILFSSLEFWISTSVAPGAFSERGGLARCTGWMGEGRGSVTKGRTRTQFSLVYRLVSQVVLSLS